ncbi:MAG: 7-cyano-7-deazaguanine synthase QueC [Pelotomaculum sp.]|uniref:7-cyano-7-deazaguanine synthase n=1 Tax=Pelotomaculum thermopropionicum (strain DSM 13744 / JCM 10971 / SI) TaxID=370438 RepID=QUEC_PELTS|nr:RecName: Full=7-cyano-7-deazaguanine synthase; AltName: Full=7-cyano-7-carbaguanine synthase; AltName: Full=PreQ(0) synthase; AltName: Full=Queuosine biosynthesis protein QueC [Pelotomaculum thermopropionicum SI]NPV73749.1 7-cyano-7-deazaguanine synthase QueC [Pelotomaculum sp.]BAF59583.1 predicted PP-loop superfamily ATPase [Pelotomaculum thermopropionicum SI]
MRSIVLLSGGLDSAVSLACSLQGGEVCLCLTFDYGQKAAEREKKAAAALAAHYKLRHRVIELPFLKEITSTALVSETSELPAAEEEELDENEASRSSAALVWVPNRNGVFINIAAAFAEAYRCDLVVTGFNREEAASFPDNSPEFVVAANASLSYSTLNKVRVASYTQGLNKTEIVKLGMNMGVPFDLIWSCYGGAEKMCRRCESCLRFIRAAKTAGLQLE